VMSSADSSILAAASLTGWNILPRFQHKALSRQNITKVIKRVIWIIGITATLIALQIRSIYDLWVLCSDFVYCLLFPALVTALFDPKANKIGAISGFFVALVLRLGGGEPIFNLPAFFPYPVSDDGFTTIPFKTVAMLSGLLTILVVSRISSSKYFHKKSN